MTVTVDTHATWELVTRFRANPDQFRTGDVRQLANLVESAAGIIGKARDALRRAGCPVEDTDDLAGLIDQYDADVRNAVQREAEYAARLRTGRTDKPTEVTEEWSAAVIRNGTTRYQSAGDAEHAAIIADSIATHVASMNEPTREAYGVTGTAVMHRTTVRYEDDYQLTSPWRKIRDGQPLKG
ncbi:hypothetical protein ABZ671_01075 [Micromonospora sp. NPDC006766]|uniref:hypothetical protein n=1 Tax=Micromonospora sp. NPDC006766 TaxID=3154778 RepID=UPI0033F1F2B5